MNKFYSSLVINSKRFPNVHQVFKPRYNKEYFKRVTANISQLEAHIGQRCNLSDPNLSLDKLKDLKENATKLVKLKERLEKGGLEDDKYNDILTQLEAIEDRLMPTVVVIPNRTSKSVPPRDTVVEEVKSDFQANENLVKVLSHRKLSYINNCYSKSVVGPNSHYYFGIGAKLQHGLSSYFTESLERENFIPVSGLCLTKSAVVEVANCKDGKNYFEDPARVITGTKSYTTLHLTESSRESLVGLIATLGPIASNKPLRLMTSGSSYRPGSDWFDGDDKRITQTETVHALILNSSIEHYSMEEYHQVRNLIWSAYKRLELPVRLVHCSTGSMLTNEFDAHRVDVWLPSRREWIQAGRVSHYRDYITVRAGMKRGHIIDSMVYDGQVLVAAIIENQQTTTGKFIIPSILTNHLTHLTQIERDSYLRTSPGGQSKVFLPPRAQTLTNHEQRRYLTKRSYVLGHGRKAQQLRRGQHGPRSGMVFLGAVALIVCFIDWKAIWLDFLPDRWRAFLYDYVWRPPRRAWVYIVSETGEMVDIPTYAELDKTDYSKLRSERYFEEIRVGTRRGV